MRGNKSESTKRCASDSYPHDFEVAIRAVRDPSNAADRFNKTNNISYLQSNEQRISQRSAVSVLWPGL